MKIAILSCNNFSIIGGGERFIFDLAEALDATIVSYGFKSDMIDTYETSNLKFQFLNKSLPVEPLKQLFGIRLFHKLHLSYDFYILMDDVAIHFIRPSTPHLYYMFTPRRALYDMYYFTLNEKRGVEKLIFFVAINLMKTYDRHFVKKHVKNIASISNSVRNRIQKTYLRSSSVIYPCIHTSKYKYLPYGNYFLSVSRIDKWKRIGLQIEAFRQLPEQNLIIVGTMYPGQEHILHNLPPNVKFLGNVTEEELIILYSKCIALITTAIDEDFGLTPLEAMASGKPVIATKEGGYLETVIDGYTGILITPTVKELISAVNQILIFPEVYKIPCINQAKKFDYEIFKEKINKTIQNINYFQGKIL